MPEHHDCAISGCAAWGVQRFTGTVPGVLEHLDGWLCESHKITDLHAQYSVGFQPGDRRSAMMTDWERQQAQMQVYATTAVEEPVWVQVPTPDPDEVFRPINRAARRAAKRANKR